MGTTSLRKNILKHSGRLFATPSFLTGLAKVLDIGSTFDSYNENASPREADYWSMISDWSAVGDDLQSALTEYDSQPSKQ
jgi:hypothetical protein